MNISIRPLIGNALLVEIQGEVDASAASEMKMMFLELIENGCLDFVVNLDKVTSIDASGLGVLISTAKKLREGNGDMKIFCSNLKMKETFQCTGLTRFFQVLETEKEINESVLASSFPCLDCPLFVGIPNCPIVKSFAYAAAPCEPGPHLQWLTRAFTKSLKPELKGKQRVESISLSDRQRASGALKK